MENVTQRVFNAYDAVWIAALTENISGNTTFVRLKKNFNKIIDSY